MQCSIVTCIVWKRRVHTNLPQLANLYLQTGSKCIGIVSSATNFPLPAVQGGTQCSYYLCVRDNYNDYRVNRTISCAGIIVHASCKVYKIHFFQQITILCLRLPLLQAHHLNIWIPQQLQHNLPHLVSNTIDTNYWHAVIQNIHAGLQSHQSVTSTQQTLDLSSSASVTSLVIAASETVLIASKT